MHMHNCERTIRTDTRAMPFWVMHTRLVAGSESQKYMDNDILTLPVQRSATDPQAAQ